MSICSPMWAKMELLCALMKASTSSHCMKKLIYCTPTHLMMEIENFKRHKWSTKEMSNPLFIANLSSVGHMLLCEIQIVSPTGSNPCLGFGKWSKMSGQNYTKNQNLLKVYKILENKSVGHVRGIFLNFCLSTFSPHFWQFSNPKWLWSRCDRRYSGKQVQCAWFFLMH